MAKKNTKRKIIGLVSEATGHRIYYTRKNTQNTPEKLSLRKYNPKTLLVETKLNHEKVNNKKALNWALLFILCFYSSEAIKSSRAETYSA